MKHVRATIAAVLVLGLAAIPFVNIAVSEPAASPPPAGEAKPANADDWLLNAPSDEARFKLLQSQARGFSASMFEVGRRYETFYDALADKNYEFAAYQWTKIKEVIQAGYTRRPKRQANADTILLAKLFEPVLADVKSADNAKSWAAFAKVRAACMACHEAEKVGYINNQPLFRKTESAK